MGEECRIEACLNDGYRSIYYTIDIAPTGQDCSSCGVSAERRIQITVSQVAGLQLTDKRAQPYIDFAQTMAGHGQLVCHNKDCDLNRPAIFEY